MSFKDLRCRRGHKESKEDVLWKGVENDKDTKLHACM
jgi:hypothetical protein